MSTNGSYYASRLWPGLFLVQAVALAFLGLIQLRGPAWQVALGVTILAGVPLHLWAAWRYLRRPLLVIAGDRLELCHPLSSHERRLRLSDLGGLKWSTRSHLCLEHATAGSVTLGVRELPRERRADLLERLGVDASGPR